MTKTNKRLTRGIRIHVGVDVAISASAAVVFGAGGVGADVHVVGVHRVLAGGGVCTEPSGVAGGRSGDASKVGSGIAGVRHGVARGCRDGGLAGGTAPIEGDGALLEAAALWLSADDGKLAGDRARGGSSFSLDHLQLVLGIDVEEAVIGIELHVSRVCYVAMNDENERNRH